MQPDTLMQQAGISCILTPSYSQYWLLRIPGVTPHFCSKESAPSKKRASLLTAALYWHKNSSSRLVQVACSLRLLPFSHYFPNVLSAWYTPASAIPKIGCPALCKTAALFNSTSQPHQTVKLTSFASLCNPGIEIPSRKAIVQTHNPNTGLSAIWKVLRNLFDHEEFQALSKIPIFLINTMEASFRLKKKKV